MAAAQASRNTSNVYGKYSVTKYNNIAKNIFLVYFLKNQNTTLLTYTDSINCITTNLSEILRAIAFRAIYAGSYLAEEKSKELNSDNDGKVVYPLSYLIESIPKRYLNPATNINTSHSIE